MTLEQLFALGFDTSEASPPDEDGKVFFRVRCSQCESLCINGVPTHEHGCPNAMHECAGCNEIIPAKHKYCEGCQ